MTPSATPAGLGATDLRSAYGLPTYGGAGQIVAIVDAYDNPNVESDLGVYRAQYGLSACTTANGCFRKVNQTGAASPLPSGDSGWGLEIGLDVQMVSAACPDCKILLVEANSNWTSDLTAAVRTAVELGASFVSNSWGGAEFPGEAAGDAAMFNYPGASIFASAGDNGYGVIYPAASRYVTSVGGTVLTKASNARGWTETVWSGTGSGCSAYISKPPWQHDTRCSTRTDNDIAAVADNVAVYDTYGHSGWLVVGGTSVASPLVAASYAIAGNNGSDPSWAYGEQRALVDITSGSDGTCGSYLCNAGSGYDGPTGNGSPNASLLRTSREHVAAVSWGPNRLDIFGIGTDKAMHHKWFDGAYWGPSAFGWEWLGGVFNSPPSVVSWGSGRLDVFGLGADNSLYHKWLDGSNWGPSISGWEPLGGVLHSPPFAVSWGPNRLDIFGLGPDNGLYHKWFDGANWGPSAFGWEPLGGVLISSISAVSWGPNRLDIFGVGTDNAMYHKWFDGSNWGPSISGWEWLGGVLNSPPSAVSWGPNRLDIFALGPDNGMYHKWFDGANWGPSVSGWEPLGGVLTSPPSAVSWAPNRLDIFGLGADVFGADNGMYHKWFDGSNWGPSISGWESLGGAFR